MDAINVHNLTKCYGNLLAVDHISFAVRQGEFFGLLGPNGAGKTTTIRMLTGLLKPTSGTAHIMGINVVKNPVDVKKQIGVISETANPYLEMSAWDNLMFAGSIHGMPKGRRKEQAENLLKLLGIYDRRDEKVEKFSKGLRKRVTIAIALVHDPPLLFLDEPTVGLDVQSARMIRELLRELNEQGTTIFLTTHYIEEADILCDRVGIIENGKLVALDSPENLKAAGREEKIVEVSFDSYVRKIENELAQLPAVNMTKKRGDKFQLYTGDPSRVIQELSKIAEEKNLKIVSLNVLTPTLEDAFVELTGFSSLDMERMEQIGRLKKIKIKGG
ncbi:ATP-binding protein [Candidatus Bathyarchaeota archaeon]|nr:MAG: ATP-binding protein [Candidatus Bathyarchaeota archaeon]